MSERSIPALLDRIGEQSPTLHAVVTRLMELMAEHAPEASAEVKYGGVHYALGPRPVGGIFAYAAHVSLEFARGAEFDDGGLGGDGKYRRHLKFTEPEQIDPAVVGRYIAEAYKRS